MEDDKVYASIEDVLKDSGFDTWSVAGTWGVFTVYELLNLEAIRKEFLQQDKMFGDNKDAEICIGRPGYILEKDGVFRFPNDEESDELSLNFL